MSISVLTGPCRPEGASAEPSKFHQATRDCRDVCSTFYYFSYVDVNLKCWHLLKISDKWNIGHKTDFGTLACVCVCVCALVISRGLLWSCMCTASHFFPHSLCSAPCPLLLLLLSLVSCRAAEDAMISDLDENNPGTEWERVARLCDFNPKSSKQAKDVSRMRSVLISLKQSPLVR